MPEAKSGTAGTIVTPVDPDPALDAADGQAGQVEQVTEFTRTAEAQVTYGSVSVQGYDGSKASPSPSPDNSDSTA